MDHFHQAGNQNTTHSASAESHSCESTSFIEKLSSCDNVPEDAPGKASGQGAALGWVVPPLTAQPAGWRFHLRVLPTAVGVWYCWEFYGDGTRELGKNKSS